MRRNHLRRAYSMDTDDYNRMLKEQDFRCAICFNDNPASPAKSGNFHVDHCHATGAVRGLLCTKCNLGIGQFNDDSTFLRRAANYIDGGI